ncbi:protein cordon-bleu isoform X3 [Esox lucius]|nr:protein cordon-bleu isoform X3 [Esox lucius]XP_028971521.2 protein cordon-bleu isoform X3 [Esox lucius]XP_034144736.1 protein cordon-bleu isoform X3 [Esox lucius]
MKSRAPPPPPAPEPAPRSFLRNTVPGGGGSLQGSMGSMVMDSRENMIKTSVELQITLPQGYQTSSTVSGSKALMDLLVDLCSQYHLNPAYHTLELLSSEALPLAFKPNTLLGTLDVAAVSIREKVLEEKVVRKPQPKVPEKTVRLVVNYNRSQKALLRVSPLVPLQSLVPAICEKCEFDPDHVLLLKDNVSNHELELDKSLSELCIRELYVQDQSLVLRHKMASAPALNYSESIHPNTSAVSEADKKGLLGFFKFSRRKSKTEEQSSMDMDALDDNAIQNNAKFSNGQSTGSMVPSVDSRPSTLGQSQSVMNISRMSPRMEPKKKRAPPPPTPTPCQDHYMVKACHVAPDSEITLRKRKAPAPPPTPVPSTPKPPSPFQSAPSPVPSSPSPSLPTEEDSGSEMSHSLEDSEPTGSVYSGSSSSSMVAADTSVADTSMVDSDSAFCRAYASKPSPDSGPRSITGMAKSSRDSTSFKVDPTPSNKTDMKTLAPDSACSNTVYSVPGSSAVKATPTPESSCSTTPKETRESSLNLKVDETENNRHSAMGAERLVPPKPPRSPVREAPQLVTPPPYHPSSPDSHSPDPSPESHMEKAPQSWLYSQQLSVEGPQTPEMETLETLSMGSSGSFQDHGYAASEGMAEAEDSGLVSTPSITTHPTFPDGSSHPMIHPFIKDSSSDTDEGCALWGSSHRPSIYISHNNKACKTKDTYEEDQELTNQLNQTLADLEADLEADLTDICVGSVQKHPYLLSTKSDDIPVSVVDIEVPVTAIDEVLEDYRTLSMTEYQATIMSSFQSTDNKDHNHSHHQSSVGDIQNKNNNARISDGSSRVCTGQPQPMQRLKSPVKKLANGAMDKETSTVSKNEAKVEVQTQRESTEGVERKTSTAPYSFTLPNSHLKCMEEEEQVSNYSGQAVLKAQTKITHNPVSRFGMKTFTIVPPKPAVVSQQLKPAESALATHTPGAIRIDEQGNMVKVGITRNKFGGSSESGINKDGSLSPPLGKAKAFWRSTDKQDTSAHSIPTTRRPVTVTKTQRPEPDVPKTTTPVEASEPRAAKVRPKASTTLAKMAPEMYKDVIEMKSDVSQEVERKATVPVSEPPVRQQSMKLTPGILQDQKRDLSFLKPSRRTSSQYVASAIAKYTVKPTMAKANNIQEVPAESSGFVRKPTSSYGCPKEGRSFNVNAPWSSSTSTNVSMKKESSSLSGFYPTSPKHTTSHPDYQVVSESKQGMDKSGYGSSTTLRDKEVSSNSLDSEIVANNTKQDRPNIPRQQTQKTLAAAQLPTILVPAVTKHSLDAPRMAAQSRTETVDPAGHPSVAKKLEPPNVCVTSASHNLSEPQQVSVFGPVKKFKPVIMKSVHTETSLHTTLMSAIQSGDSKERLKKMSDSSASSTLKKLSIVEEENERCALLAAIRGQSNSARLKKTKSQAAEEVDKFRKTELGKNRTLYVASPAMCPPPSFLPPPPPIASMLPPPPAPHSTLGAGGDSVLARDAMLEAIRSGSAAERLKKVTAPMTTVQVNSRLGTIKAVSSLSQGQ